jgi:hypothetical protein
LRKNYKEGMKMKNTENFIENILKELDIPINKYDESKIEKVKILSAESIKDDNYEELIGSTFIVSFKCEDRVGIEYNNDILWFKSSEYEFVEE